MNHPVFVLGLVSYNFCMIPVVCSRNFGYSDPVDRGDMFHVDVDISTISTNTAGEEDNSERRLVNADKAALATHKSAGMK